MVRTPGALTARPGGGRRALGDLGALAEVFPKARKQRCWNHRILNLLDRVPKSRQAEARRLLTPIPCAEARKEAERLKGKFQ